MEAKKIKNAYAVVLWAMERKLRKTNQAISDRIALLRGEIEREFGPKVPLLSALLGPLLLWSANREEKRQAAGKTYEPPTFVERRNW